MSNVRFVPFATESKSTPSPNGLLEDMVPPSTPATGWVGFSTDHKPVPFVAPAWDRSASEREPSAVDASPLDTAQEQSPSLLQDAEQEIQRLKDEAYAAGYTAGEAQGFEAGQQRVHAVVESLGQALQEVGRLQAQIFEQSEGEVLELALAIARKVLHDEGSFHRDSILALIRAGIKKATQRQDLHIRVHPADFLFTMSCKAQLMSYLDGIETILFKEDETVPPGSCVIETPSEIIDLRWDEQLEEIAASLSETYELARQGDVA